MNWAGIYYDHFAKFLKKPVGLYKLDGPEHHSIQILVFKPIKEVTAFCTVGLSHYSQQLGGLKELFLAVDAGEEQELIKILGYCVTALVYNSIYLKPGVYFDGVDKVAPKFSAEFDKTALYFTNPLGFKENKDFEIVHLDDDHHGLIYMGFFITASECAFLKQYGPDVFERLLEECDIDPTNIERVSTINT